MRCYNRFCGSCKQCSRLDGTDGNETAHVPARKVLMQDQQALLNAEIDQQRKSLEGNTVVQDACKSSGDY